MTTRLDSILKRALTIDGREYVLTLTSAGLKLSAKGKRKGFEVQWSQIVSGDAALAVALHASLGAFPGSAPAAPIETKNSKQRGRARHL